MRHNLVMMLWNPRKAAQQSLQQRLINTQDVPQWLYQRAQLAVQAAKVKFDAQLARELTQMFSAVAESGLEIVTEKLKNGEALSRWAGVQVVGRKRLHLEAELIDRISDRSPQVRQAAREALARLSCGNDFGPLPNATAKQIAQSAHAWRQWLSLQDPPERLPEYLSFPQPEETELPPVQVAELLPPPRPADADDALE